MKANLQNQGSFDFEAAPPPEPIAEPPKLEGRKLDADGHYYWARFCRESQENCIAQAGCSRDEVEIYAWSALAKQWKVLAADHEAKGHLLEGERG